jgi:hypothetical protein
MCWACDKDQATALLEDARRVFSEARVLRKHAGQMQAQAYDDLRRAVLRRVEDNTICKEQEDACETT